MNYQEKALQYAERHGITSYKVSGATMIYYENFYDGTYKAVVNLKTMKETRTLLKRRRKSTYIK